MKNNLPTKIGLALTLLVLGLYVAYSVVQNQSITLIGEVPQDEQNSILGIASSADLIIDNKITDIIENSDNSFTISYVYTINNIGGSRIYDINSINNLANAFSPYNFTIESKGGSNLAVNSNFNGSSTTELLVGSDDLNPGEEGKVFLKVRLYSNKDTGPFENFVEVTGLVDGPDEEQKDNEHNSESENTQDQTGENTNNNNENEDETDNNEGNNNTGNNNNSNDSNNNSNNNSNNSQDKPKKESKPNKEPKMNSCPNGYEIVSQGTGNLKNDNSKNKNDVRIKFPEQNLGKLKLAIATKEGHPELTQCTASGKESSHPYCSQYQNFESYRVNLGNTKIFEYTDHKNPEKQNWWFKNWTTKKIKDLGTDEITLSFEHARIGDGPQSVDYKYILCIQTEEIVKPTATATPTPTATPSPTPAVEDSNNSGDSSEQESAEESSQEFDSTAYNSASSIFTLIIQSLESTGDIDGTADLNDTNEPTNETPTENETGQVNGNTTQPADNEIISFTSVNTNSYTNENESIEGVVLGGATNNNGSLLREPEILGATLQDTGFSLQNISFIGLGVVILTVVINLSARKNKWSL